MHRGLRGHTPRGRPCRRPCVPADSHRTEAGRRGACGALLRAAQAADTLHELGFKGLRATGLRRKHVVALVREWKRQGRSIGTMNPSCPIRKTFSTNTLRDNRSVRLPLPFARGVDALASRVQPGIGGRVPRVALAAALVECAQDPGPSRSMTSLTTVSPSRPGSRTASNRTVRPSGCSASAVTASRTGSRSASPVP